ncbi:MAG: ABC transporter permease, partial [Opitutae bacterium]|nr:ABC transporter permease [Opitutae bacterium]
MPKIVIEAGHSERQYWKDLWHFRELFYFLAWRDILVRYKQTLIGIAWAVIRPLLTMAILVVVFNKLAKLPSDGTAPYPILVFAAMLPWQFFSTSLSEASNSLVVNSNLISKVYFPRLVVPASAVITSLVDFAISLGLLAGLMVIYQFAPTWKILTLPLFTLL